MAKFKAAKRKPKVSPTRGLIPCLLLILGGIALFSLFFYAMLKSGN
jgi:hypothetical protein